MSISALPGSLQELAVKSAQATGFEDEDEEMLPQCDAKTINEYVPPFSLGAVIEAFEEPTVCPNYDDSFVLDMIDSL